MRAPNEANLAHDKDEEAKNQDHRQQHDQPVEKGACIGGTLYVDGQTRQSFFGHTQGAQRFQHTLSGFPAGLRWLCPRAPLDDDLIPADDEPGDLTSRHPFGYLV